MWFAEISTNLGLIQCWPTSIRVKKSSTKSFIELTKGKLLRKVAVDLPSQIIRCLLLGNSIRDKHFYSILSICWPTSVYQLIFGFIWELSHFIGKKIVFLPASPRPLARRTYLSLNQLYLIFEIFGQSFKCVSSWTFLTLISNTHTHTSPLSSNNFTFVLLFFLCNLKYLHIEMINLLI